jgi:hypothetical protein
MSADAGDGCRFADSAVDISADCYKSIGAPKKED